MPTRSPGTLLGSLPPDTRRSRLRDAILARQFPRLVMHFAANVFRGNQTDDSSGFDFGLPAILGIFAVPGLFFSAVLFDKYSTLIWIYRGSRKVDMFAASAPDSYLLIALSMCIIGLVTVLKWDTVFPSRQDFLNLAYLPISATRMFAANVIALVLLAGIFALDVNAASLVLFPMAVSAAQHELYSYVQFASAHLFTVLLSAAFVCSSCLLVMAAMMSVLPATIFRTASVYVRIGLVIALVAIFTPGSAPVMWFVGLQQTLIGTGTAVHAQLARIAIVATSCSVVLAGSLYAVSYRRHFLRTAEIADSGAGHTLAFRWPEFVESRLFSNSFERACYYFTLRTLIRSETHCLLLGGIIGGGALVVYRDATALIISLNSAYCLIVGLRVAFHLPVNPAASWVFQLNPGTDEAIRAAVSKVVLTLLTLAVVIPTFILFVWRANATTALQHSAFVLMMSLLLIQWLYRRTYSVPFASPTPQFRQSLILWVAVALLGLILFTASASLDRPMVVIFLPLAIWFSRWLEPRVSIFDVAPDVSGASVQLLNLPEPKL